MVSVPLTDLVLALVFPNRIAMRDDQAKFRVDLFVAQLLAFDLVAVGLRRFAALVFHRLRVLKSHSATLQVSKAPVD